MALIVGAMCVIFGVLPALFCKGMDAGKMENRKRISLNTLSSSFKELGLSIKEVFKNKNNLN